METISPKRPVHVGHNIQTIRFIRGMSQTEMAAQLEERTNRPFSQQLISDIEGRENIEDEGLLRQIAEILKVEPEALKNLDLDDAINIIGNSFHDNSSQQINYKNTVHNQQTYNVADKLLEMLVKDKADLKTENETLKKELEALKTGKGKKK
jgi:transcriptional regulator with XRE-family HTH domain